LLSSPAVRNVRNTSCPQVKGRSPTRLYSLNTSTALSEARSACSIVNISRDSVGIPLLV
jgi:hypothetical protein